MQTIGLGPEIRRLRGEGGITLRGLAATVEVSAAHLSDIENNRRRPSDELLRRLARALRRSGATFESFELLATGLDAETRAWAGTTPGVRALLRMLKQSGLPLLQILPDIEKVIGRKKAGTKRSSKD